MSSLNKLLRVERTLSIYLKKVDEPLQEIALDIIPLDKLIEIVTPKIDDPYLYDAYKLSKKQIEKINQFLGEKIVTDFKKHDYFLVAGGIYDWQSDR